MGSINRVAVSVLLAGGSALVLSTAAFAQSAADEDTGFGDIIVTAQKREQNLQDIPISISAVTGEQAELQGISEVKDLGALAPNVTVLGGTTNATAAVVSIRGIPTPADETQGFDSPIGLYLDGVYLARSSTASFEVADIERIEVLRGPQGTLFGRNTTGGAVNFITKEPTDDFGAKLKIGYGNYDQGVVRGSLDTGNLFDNALRMTFSALYKTRDGVVDNLLQPNDHKDPGGYTTTGFRWATVLDLSDNVRVKNIFDVTKTSGVPHAQQLAATGTGVPNPTVFVPGFANVVPAPITQYLAQSSIAEAAQGCGKTASLTRVDPICQEAAGASTDKVWGNLFRVEAELEGVTIRTTTAFRKWRNNIRGSDLDGLGTIRGAVLGAPSTTFNGFPLSVLSLIPTLNPPLAPPGTAAFISASPVPSANVSLFQATNNRRQNQFSQELELVSNTDGDFNWVLGGFYFKENGFELNNQRFGFVLDTNQTVYNATNFGALAPLLQANNPARYRAALQNVFLGYRAGGRSTAVYGQAEYRPGGKDGQFGVTLGLRYTWDRKSMTRFQNGATPYTNPVEIALNKGFAKFSDWTGHLTADYRPSEDMTVYGRVARGYRSGGFNARQPTNVAANLGLRPFDNEIIWSFEAGFKAEFAGIARLNGAVFYNDYSDLQLAIPIPITGGGSFGTAVANAGKVRYTGFELEGQIRPTENFWFDGNVGYTHKKFKEYNSFNDAGVPTNIASVFKSGYSPDWTAAMAANGRFDVTGDVKAIARVGWTYTGSYFQFGNPITAPFKEQTKGDSRGLWDAQLRIEGLSLGGSGDIGLTFWGKNLGNKKYVSRSVDFGQLGFAGTIYGDPRTYGVTLDIGF